MRVEAVMRNEVLQCMKTFTRKRRVLMSSARTTERVRVASKMMPQMRHAARGKDGQRAMYARKDKTCCKKSAARSNRAI